MTNTNATYADVAKEAAAKEAVKLIDDGMRIGIGTGSTAAFFIKHLAKRVQEGLKITAVATSKRSEELAKQQGITIVDSSSIQNLDLAVDGADEVDSTRALIKGGGGALLREKIIANACYQFIIIVDDGKLVDKIGKKHPLPIEVVPFACNVTRLQIETLGFTGDFRKDKNGEFYITDNGNYIYDAKFRAPPDMPDLTEDVLHDISGVVETGLFLHLASRVIVGFPDGHTENR